MKILLLGYPWVGKLQSYVKNAFVNSNNEVKFLYPINERRKILEISKLYQIKYFDRKENERLSAYYNKNIIQTIKAFNPDICFIINEAEILPDTAQYLGRKCLTICTVGDNPFDSRRFRFFPYNLKYYKYIFVYDKAWIPSIRNIAPLSNIIKTIGGAGVDTEVFYPIDESELTAEDRTRLQCDMSFTGESYGNFAEGGYRASILYQLVNYNLKIWGDSRWNNIFKFLPELKPKYIGERLPIEDLRKLYFLSTINLNMPSPQVLTSFQPRVFEIAACKGFQIVDWREELDEIFNEDEIITFKNINDLKEKINYFLKYPEKRIPYVNNLHNKVINNYTWKKYINRIFRYIDI